MAVIRAAGGTVGSREGSPVPLAVRGSGSWVPQGWSDGLCPTRDGDNLARGGHGGRGGRRRSRFGGGADTVAAGLGLGWGERGLEDDPPACGLGNVVEEACALRGGSGCVCESGVQGVKVGEVGGQGGAGAWREGGGAEPGHRHGERSGRGRGPAEGPAASGGAQGGRAWRLPDPEQEVLQEGWPVTWARGRERLPKGQRGVERAGQRPLALPRERAGQRPLATSVGGEECSLWSGQEGRGAWPEGAQVKLLSLWKVLDLCVQYHSPPLLVPSSHPVGQHTHRPSVLSRSPRVGTGAGGTMQERGAHVGCAEGRRDTGAP